MRAGLEYVLLAAALLSAGCSKRDSEARATAAEALSPDAISDTALVKQFDSVSVRFPMLGEYLTRQEGRVVLAAAAASGSCLTFKQRLLLTTAAKALRQSLCPDTLLVASDVGGLALEDCKRRCLLISIRCLNGGKPFETCRGLLAECTRQCPGGATCPPQCP